MQFTRDIMIKGEHASMMREIQDMVGMYAEKPTFIDMYLTAGATGVMHNIRSKDEAVGDAEVCSIPRNVLSNRAASIDFLFQVCALNEYFYEDEEKAVNVAFADNSGTNTALLHKQILFHEYAMGGLEVLYSAFVKDSEEEPMKLLYDFVNNNIQEPSPQKSKIDQILENI